LINNTAVCDRLEHLPALKDYYSQFEVIDIDDCDTSSDLSTASDTDEERSKRKNEQE